VDLPNNLENEIDVLDYGHDNKVTAIILQIKSKGGVLQLGY
jgi:hypothetical protein